MPTYKYGARTFHCAAGIGGASTNASIVVEAWTYMPSALDGGTVDKAQEFLFAGSLTFLAPVSQAASTATSGSVIVAATHYNSLGNSVHTAALYNQSSASQAPFVPIDTSALHQNWALSPGDLIALGLNANTAGVPANFPAMVWSASVGAF